MSRENRAVDHLVYCVSDLDKAILEFQDRLGVTATMGGKHLSQGTKNAIISLGYNCYLELLAVDKENRSVPGNRWMGIDYLQENKITRWALQTTGLTKDLDIIRAHNKELGELYEGSRLTTTGQLLRWKMTRPLSSPEIELVPFLIDWSSSAAHPADGLPVECKLLDLTLHVPVTQLATNNCVSALAPHVKIKAAEAARITAVISSPNGIVEL